MIAKKSNESRKDYLLRVTLSFLRENWEAQELTIDYDETTCDGNCLADDIEAEIEEEQNNLSFVELAQSSFPKNPHEGQTCLIKAPTAGFIKDAARQGWQWASSSYLGVRFVFLPNYPK